MSNDVEKAATEPLMKEKEDDPVPDKSKVDDKSTGKALVDGFCIALNTVCTVGLVFLNKKIFQYPQFKRMQALIAMWHFACTAIVLYTASRKPFSLFEPVRINFIKMLPLCCFFTGFLVLNNLSLTFNSVGFYQMAKIMTTPAVVVLNYCLFSKTISGAMVLSLVAICIGVGLTNTNGVQSNFFGAGIACAAFTVTAAYQIWIGKKLKDFQVSSPQLLLNQAPISCLLLVVVAPITDTVPFGELSSITSEMLVALFFSGIVASVLNLSQFLIIGRTSALTFNVASNLKTICILTFAWIGEGRIMSFQDIVGVILAVGGAAVYSQLSR